MYLPCQTYQQQQLVVESSRLWQSEILEVR
jgi:hypothetical protein